MRDLLSHREEARTKSGDLVAALLFVSCIFVVSAIAVASHVLLSPKDSLAEHMPASVAIYVHADGRVAVNQLSTIAPFSVPETTATEIAHYAVPGDDGALVWRTLLGWRWPYAPTKADMTTLNANRVVMVNERAALFGAYSPDPSFGLDQEAEKILKEARSRARIQAYADLSSLRPLGTSDIIIKDRFVAGIVIRDESSFARITRVDDGVTAEALSSFMLPFPDPFSILFGEYPSEEQSLVTQKAAADAAHYLNERLETIVILDPGTSAAHTQLILQNTNATEARRALDAYATHRWPEKTPFLLPDGDILREIRSASSDTNPTLRLGPAPQDLAKLHEIPGGVIIAKEGDIPPKPVESCPITGTPALILRGEKGVVPWLPYATMVAGRATDNALIVCARK